MQKLGHADFVNGIGKKPKHAMFQFSGEKKNRYHITIIIFVHRGVILTFFPFILMVIIQKKGWLVKNEELLRTQMDQNELNEEKELKQVCETIDNKK